MQTDHLNHLFLAASICSWSPKFWRESPLGGVPPPKEGGNSDLRKVAGFADPAAGEGPPIGHLKLSIHSAFSYEAKILLAKTSCISCEVQEEEEQEGEFRWTWSWFASSLPCVNSLIRFFLSQSPKFSMHAKTSTARTTRGNFKNGEGCCWCDVCHNEDGIQLWLLHEHSSRSSPELRRVQVWVFGEDIWWTYRGRRVGIQKGVGMAFLNGEDKREGRGEKTFPNADPFRSSS